jgi:SAM-dependent methyltransferase
MDIFGKDLSGSEKMTDITTCPICKCRENILLSEKLRYESPRKVYKCNDCGIVFLYPQMTEEEERIFYEREYGEIYSNEKGTTPEKLFEARLPDARTYFDWTRNAIDKTDDCLELGCASGYFLATIKDHVRSVAGMETHFLLKEHCRKIGIRIFESLAECEDGQFDRIFMFFLLEHIGDPVTFLQSVKRVLKKNGKLFIVVPNIDDALMSLYDIQGFRSFYFTPAHQFYYSKDTLSHIISLAGMPDVKIFPRQRYDLSNHMHWMMHGKPGGTGKFNGVFSALLLSEYAKNLEDKFLCDTLFAVVTK